MTKDELIEELGKLAIRFSKGWHEGIKIDASDIMLFNQIAEALAQPEQEPVAWEQLHEHIAGPFYTHPTQRTWVGLTDDETALIAADCSLVTPSDFYFVKAIEAKLKELNT